MGVRAALATTWLAACSIVTGCMYALPRDRSIESSFPKTSTTTGLPSSLRVVTYNVHGKSGDKIVEALRSERELRNVDLIIMEEVKAIDGVSAATVVAQKLGYYSVYAPGYENGNSTNGVAIVSRAPILSAEVIEIPFFHVIFNGGRTTGLAATMMLDGQPITVYAVHLTNRLTVKERRRQMMPVIEHAKRQQTPVIIGGDFNTSPFTWVARMIPIPTGTQDDRFEELMRSHGFDTPVADSGATSRYIGMKLDGIYTRGFDTTKFATADGNGLSDHLALWAQLTVRSGTHLAMPIRAAAP